MSQETAISKAPYTPLQVANTFINFAQSDGGRRRDLTPLKLIKLTYFFYAWYLALCKQRAFSELPVAMKHGPVFPSVYAAFSHYKRQHIDNYHIEYSLDDETLDIPVLSNNDEDKNARLIVAAIWKFYKNHSAWELRDITHEQDGAWRQVWDDGRGEGRTIELDEVIKNRAQLAINKVLA